MKIEVLKDLTEPIFYITNDVSRGLGLEKLLPNYHLVCLDDHPLVDILLNAGVSVFCLERALGQKNVLFRTSGSILSHPLVLDFIKEKSAGVKPNILFFKPQKRIEILARENNFHLLGNSAEINRIFEDKVEFYKLCQNEGIKVPLGEIADLGVANYQELVEKYGRTLVVQFGRGWAGNSTFFINSEAEWTKLKQNFGPLAVKVSRFIPGKTVLNNAVIWGEQVLTSRPALQVKADFCLTASPGGTGGRQWPVDLTAAQEEEIQILTQKVGKIMAQRGYRGFFGLDFLIEESTGEVFLSENNARLTASVPFYTQLELESGSFPLLGFHLLTFLNYREERVDWRPPKVEGGEVIARNTQNCPVKVLSSPKTGLYDFNFNYRGAVSGLDGQKDVFWLEAVAEGRVVNPEIEIFKIDTLTLVCNQEGVLTEKMRQLIKLIKEKLIFTPC